MSNEELVKEIQAGNTRAKNELWERIYRLVYTFCIPYRTHAAEKYMDMEDLMHAAWFGVERAIRMYREDKGLLFTTYLQYNVLNAIRELLGLRGAREPATVSLDEPLDAEGEYTRLHTLEDEGATNAFENAEERAVASWLWERVERLPEREREVIVGYYRDEKTLSELSKKNRYSLSRAQQIKNHGLRLLRKDKEIEQYRSEFAYHHVTLSMFRKTWTSSTELAVLKMEQEGLIRLNRKGGGDLGK